MAEPSKEAVSLVMRIKGKYRHGDPVDENHALDIDRFAAQGRSSSRSCSACCADAALALSKPQTQK